MILNCKTCGKEFKTYPSRIKIRKGKYCSKECCFKALKGRPSPFKGIKMTREQKNRLNLKGLELGRVFWKGKKRLDMIGHAWNKGRIPWNKDKKGYSTSLKGKKRLDIEDEKNPAWKGKNVGYNALHDWVKKRFKKPDFCPQCHSSKYIQLANISFEYKRDLSDWMYLCASCHRYYDRKNGWGMATKKFDLNSKT